MKRGRSPAPCPDPRELQRAWAFDPRIGVVARQLGANPKQVRRWLGEIGVSVPVRPTRKRGEVPAFARHAYAPRLGKRVQTRLYRIWTDMKGRCTNPHIRSYADYGARGIRVCDEWQDFAVFRAWAISSGYTKEGTIDRKDVDGHYEPNNCGWLPLSRQQWNTRRVIKLTVDGVTKSLPEWAAECGVSSDIFRNRRQCGWTDEQIVKTPFGCPRFDYIPRKRGPKPQDQFAHSLATESALEDGLEAEAQMRKARGEGLYE